MNKILVSKEKPVMKKFITILLLMYSFSSFGEKGFFGYPSYEDVLDNFYNYYSVKNAPLYSELRFEKRKKGWYIAFYNFINREKLSESIFWSREKDMFLDLKLEKIYSPSENDEIKETKLKDKYHANHFEQCLYYGYDGWYHDVIAEVENKTNKNVYEIFSLGMAYSFYSSIMLHENVQYSIQKDVFKFKNYYENLTEIQLDEYRNKRHLAIECFEEVQRKNPNFITFIGEIKTKVAFEYLKSFYDILIYANHNEAFKELSDGLYPGYILSFAKNQLISCPENAVLFTEGDNGTYPLLYLQYFYHFREDVLIVDINRLNSSRYIEFIKTDTENLKGLNISFTKEQLKDPKYTLIWFSNTSSNSTMNLNKVIKTVKSSKDSNIYIYSNKIYFDNGKNKIKWEVKDGYLMKSKLIFLDFLLQNNWKRPICFPISNSQNSMYDMNDYLALEGMIFRLTKNKKTNNNSLSHAVNPDKLYNILLNHINWEDVSKSNSNGISDSYIMKYRIPFHNLAQHYIKKNEFDSANIVLDKCIETLPDSIASYDFISIFLAEDYFLIKSFNKGIEIFETIIENIENEEYTNIKMGLLNPEIDIKKTRFLIEYMKYVAKKHQQTYILERINSLKN